MKSKPIIIVAGEPNSIFFEIFFKSIRLKKYKSPLILICCVNSREEMPSLDNLQVNLELNNLKIFPYKKYY